MPLSDDFWKQEQEALSQMLILFLAAAATDSVESISAEIDPAEAESAVLEWAKPQAEKLAKEITANSRDAIEKAVESGVPLDDVLDRVLGDSRAELIAVTETTRSLARGVIVAARQPNGKGQVQWHTAHDELTCLEWCAPLNNEIRNVDESFGENVWGELAYGPPMHPDCRCQLTPYVE